MNNEHGFNMTELNIFILLPQILVLELVHHGME